MLFKEEADSCRRKASEFAGRPEAPFLLSVARAFDELATSGDSGPIMRFDRPDRSMRPKIHA
jgi:hypothetical protein